jgi:hypothetical protein
MNDTQASEAARHLARRRWGDSVIRRAIGELAERQDQLDSEQRRALAFLAQDPKGQRDD